MENHNITKIFKLAVISVYLMLMGFSFAPNLAFAQTARQYNSGVDKQIEQFLCAPTNSATSTSASNDDLYKCINRIYRFSLAIASVFAVFFIVIGGYIYMSAAGNQESVDKAKNILETSIASLVILAGGYVLLRYLNPDLIKFQPIQPPSVVGRERAYSLATLTKDQLLGYFGTNITADSGVNKNELKDVVKQELATLKQKCNCTVNITSTTGGQHVTSGCSHSTGNKADFGMNTALDNYIINSSGFTKIANRKDTLGEVAQWKNNSTGAIYAKEDFKSTANWNGKHWDLQVCD